MQPNHPLTTLSDWMGSWQIKTEILIHHEPGFLYEYYYIRSFILFFYFFTFFVHQHCQYLNIFRSKDYLINLTAFFFSDISFRNGSTS